MKRYLWPAAAAIAGAAGCFAAVTASPALSARASGPAVGSCPRRNGPFWPRNTIMQVLSLNARPVSG